MAGRIDVPDRGWRKKMIILGMFMTRIEYGDDRIKENDTIWNVVVTGVSVYLLSFYLCAQYSVRFFQAWTSLRFNGLCRKSTIKETRVIFSNS